MLTACFVLYNRHRKALVMKTLSTIPSFSITATPQETVKDDSIPLPVETALLGAPSSPRPLKTTKAPPKKGRRRNKVVEAFFSTEDKSQVLFDEVNRLAADLQDFLVATRRELHRHPELMYQEHDTSHFIQKTLKQMDISFTTGWGFNTHLDRIPGKGGYGVVADIGTGHPPCVLLRADMDALPIFEKTPGIDDFKSTRDGKMHACGHDGHTAMLLGAASILNKMKGSINGTVRLMFQPAEEGGAGAKRMVEEGVLTKEPAPQQAFCMHMWPSLPSGVVASRPGTIKGAAERFEISVEGVGGHAAKPHLAVDPIVAASSIVMNLQTLVSRTLSPLESGVCSITKIEAGHAYNVIPATAVLRGTVRALSLDTLMSLRESVERVVTSTADAHGCSITITYSPDFYPPTSNDPELFEDFSKEIGAMVSCTNELMNVEPGMGAEDFGFIAEELPSTYFLLGSGSGMDPASHYGLHHPCFAIDESVLPRGVALHVNLALRALKKLGEESEEESEEEDT